MTWTLPFDCGNHRICLSCDWIISLATWPKWKANYQGYVHRSSSQRDIHGRAVQMDCRRGSDVICFLVFCGGHAMSMLSYARHLLSAQSLNERTGTMCGASFRFITLGSRRIRAVCGPEHARRNRVARISLK